MLIVKHSISIIKLSFGNCNIHFGISSVLAGFMFQYVIVSYYKTTKKDPLANDLLGNQAYILEYVSQTYAFFSQIKVG